MSGAALLVFARCAGFVFRAPGLSHPSVPAPVRAGLALAMTGALATRIKPAAPDGVAFVASAVMEVAIGAAIGIAASMLYDGAYAGGRALDDYVGIRGSVPNAQIYAAAGFGRIWSLVFTAGFFLLGGYRIAILAFAHTFDVFPPGSVPQAHDLYAFALTLPAAIVEAAILVAGPAIALVFVAQIALGSLARVTPRFSGFTLTFPVMFGAALLATIAGVPALFERSAIPWLRLVFVHG
ncbi:MAG TPA: flagellar biosynthetic protein FliR [Candidatus Rubrimentiphilum sp.]|nr:flagellar biosynthetic protein FliR [Candidatus Rubrimentiphilum sp.]